MTSLLSVWRNWRERREILRDIRRRQADASEQDRFVVRDELEEALSVAALNDRHKATAIWTRVRDRYPTEVRASPLALDVLLKLHRYDEAEALMREGRRKRPGDIHFAKGLAVVAQARGDHDAAIGHFAALRKQFPGVAQGYVLGAQSLAARNRVDEADVLVQRAIKLFPQEIGGFLEYARLAARRADWPEALRRWQIVQEAFNNRSFGFCGQAHALVNLERYDEADELLEVACVRFPTSSELFTEHARCAQARGDYPEAMRRWNRRVERAPMEISGYYNAAAAFVQMGEFAQAEAILRLAVDRFPKEEGPLTNLARFFRERQDFSREAEVWGALRQTFADNGEAVAREADALRRSGHPNRAAELIEQHKNRRNQ